VLRRLRIPTGEKTSCSRSPTIDFMPTATDIDMHHGFLKVWTRSSDSADVDTLVEPMGGSRRSMSPDYR